MQLGELTVKLNYTTIRDLFLNLTYIYDRYKVNYEDKDLINQTIIKNLVAVEPKVKDGSLISDEVLDCVLSIIEEFGIGGKNE